MAFKKHGYYAQGNRSVISAESHPDETKYVDKDPFYRTTDILNGAYKKKPPIKLQQGEYNATDLKNIFVNFGETYRCLITERVGPGKSQQSELYKLECGHEWEGKSGHITGKDYGHCWTCGTAQAYLGFEHEWQHVIFKSDLAMRKLFVENYAKALQAQTPDLDVFMLEGFLGLLTNVFDDLRCNSLWEKVYPGSAEQIWKRWRRLTEERGDSVNKNFMDFVFAVAFDIPTDPNGEFESLRPIVKWGTEKAKYRGFMNMLIDVRIVVDHCVQALLAKFQKKQQAPMQQGNANVPQQGGGGGAGALPGSPQNDEPEEGDPDSGAGGARDAEAEGQDASAQGQVPQAGVDPAQPGTENGQAPSVPAPGAQGGEKGKADALKLLMSGASELDEKEKHLPPTDDQLADLMSSQSAMAALRKALQADVSDPAALDQLLPDNVVDQDMAQAITQLMNGVATKSPDSQLVGDAKSKVLLINVTSDAVKSEGGVELSPEDENNVRRMRAAFFRALGRQKAKRSMEGTVIDVPAYINYKLDRQDPEVFENDAPQQGFAYSILCDMSGSMQGTFLNVCHAVEMLKRALHFPFVSGNLWGFRGGQTVANRPVPPGEVWIYRYGKEVKGYTGFQRVQAYKNVVTVPVGCGGSTPMNPAINVTVSHLWKKVPSGMAKRLFLLTDGSPCSTKVTGVRMPDWMLRRFVAKEINVARKHGIQVYTLVIGHNAIPEDQCREMFGLPRFWRRVEDRNKTGSVLAQLVLDNFQKYIKARG